MPFCTPPIARPFVHLAIACAFIPSAAIAETTNELGTLLFSPEQRQAIVQARKGHGSGADLSTSGTQGSASASPTGGATDGSTAGTSGGAPTGASGSEAAAAAASSPTVRLDGVVSRSRGKGTAWVNGEPVAQGASRSTVITGSEAVVDGHRLRVGQSFDKTTGAKSDIVAPGAVRKRPAP